MAFKCETAQRQTVHTYSELETKQSSLASSFDLLHKHQTVRCSRYHTLLMWEQSTARPRSSLTHTHHLLDHYQCSLHNNQPLSALAKCSLFIISAITSIHLNLGLIVSSVDSSVHRYLFSFQVTIQWFLLTLNGLKSVTSWPEMTWRRYMMWYVNVWYSVWF